MQSSFIGDSNFLVGRFCKPAKTGPVCKTGLRGGSGGGRRWPAGTRAILSAGGGTGKFLLARSLTCTVDALPTPQYIRASREMCICFRSWSRDPRTGGRRVTRGRPCLHDGRSRAGVRTLPTVRSPDPIDGEV